MKKLVAALIEKDGKFLLVHNAKYGLRVEPTGGKVKDNESPEKAIEREAKEELGIEIKPMSLFGTYKTHSAEGEFEVDMYICEIKKGEPKIPTEEEGKLHHFEWYSLDDMETMKDEGILAPNLAEALPKLRKSREFKFR